MKSYLTGSPSLKLMLNEDLTMSDSNTPGSIILDDCNFHESVNHGEFLMNKALKITPPEGEFVVMNYRITTDFNAPFKVFAFFETENPYKLILTIKVYLSINLAQIDIPKRHHSFLHYSEIQCSQKSIKYQLGSHQKPGKPKSRLQRIIKLRRMAD